MSYSDDIGRLCQGVVTGDQGPRKQHVAGTDTFNFIRYNNIPPEGLVKITCTKVVCEVHPQKDSPNRTRITIGVNYIVYPVDVGTPTGSLKLFKLVFDGVLSCPGAHFACFNVKNIYLKTPMNRPKYMCIKIDDIPQ